MRDRVGAHPIMQRRCAPPHVHTLAHALASAPCSAAQHAPAPPRGSAESRGTRGCPPPRAPAAPCNPCCAALHAWGRGVVVKSARLHVHACRVRIAMKRQTDSQTRRSGACMPARPPSDTYPHYPLPAPLTRGAGGRAVDDARARQLRLDVPHFEPHLRGARPRLGNQVLRLVACK